ncbi:MAG: hypothetical protein ABEJ22_05650 [Haloferacaceae archaeon]
MSGHRRAQVVLAAAAVVAVALVPMVLAYHQLAYDADVPAAGDADVREAVGYLERSVDDAARAVAGEYGWPNWEAAASATDERLGPHVRRLESSALADDVVYRVTRNETAARSWAEADCPDADMRRFGPCRTVDGLVFQRRAGEVHLVAAAFDLRVVAVDQSARLTVLIRGYGRRVSP